MAVTRTSHIGRPGKSEEVQTGTYQFRLHRHQGDNGEPFWVAVDFLSPISNKWVSESAGIAGRSRRPAMADERPCRPCAGITRGSPGEP